ncbi:hypothetical protein BDQ94DRAFT_164631 [Aspergillus welwitschiae]|uniref:Uncharacterized protein n=1 Tax=Aspergillus welwitschiae TaxID=1341132 RepID=A0A3F3PIT3_9EURO|nr:hypothetical protein BDQ94DRAFT_164631 [Aspergillus welwitschiae]RDH26256.1 hypothetical protein BDQ94DRAFT_164631 [Aspergillus welwitschiae]
MGDEVQSLPVEPATRKSLTQPRLTSLPFPAQHRVLRVLQQRLERSAFESIQKWHPQLGQSNGWDCAEKVELHMAFRALDRKRRTQPTSGSSEFPKKAVNQLRADIEGIRHAAVHRQLQDHRRLLHQLHSAREFATVWLGDPQCGMEIEQCQMRINRLFSGWKARTRRLQGNLAARMGCNRMPEDRRHQLLLLEATRRLLERTNHDCVGQVDYILQASFPSLYTKMRAGHAQHDK